MICPNCKKEMETGFIFSTKDGAFSFADKVPCALEKAKHAESFVKITAPKVGGRASIPACCCEECRTVIIEY